MSELMTQDKEYIAGTYARFPVEIIRGEGSVVYDTDGKRYIDMGSGIGVTSFGFNDQEWIAAVTAQLGKVQHTSNLYYTEPCVKLAQLLCQKTGMKKVFFSNSGAEANECAIKVARKYAAEKKGADYFTIITMVNSFHGRTLTTLAATGQDHYHELFQPLTPGFAYCEPGNIEQLKELVATVKPAAVMMEMIQGEGGVLNMPVEFVQAAQKLCAENDVVLIVDEVQTGNGRTGTLYAYMQYGISPDVVSTAKGIGGGLPLGATMLGENVQNVLGFGDHGSTFGGNPVCCAGAVNIISRMDEAFLADVKAKGEYIRAELSGAKGIEAISGLGMIVGIKSVKPAGDCVKAMMAKGVLCLTAKDKIRLLPALNIPMSELKEAVAVIKEVCAED